MVSRIEKNKKQRTDIAREEQIKKTKNITRIVIKITIILVIFLSIIYVSCRYVGTSGLIVKEYGLEYENLPDNFYGLKIVQISDINYNSKTVNLVKIKKMIKKINYIKPDIIVFTGDLIHGKIDSAEMEKLESELSELKAKIGKYAVSGEDDDNSHIALKNAGFVIIDNDYDLIYNKDYQPIVIVGVDSNDTDLENAFRYIDEKQNLFTIAIMHKPDTIDDILNYYHVDLAMAGHSLNGLIQLPKIGGIFTFDGAKKYFDSYYRVENTDLFISGGIGTRDYPYRLFNHPSINFYRLK